MSYLHLKPNKRYGVFKAIGFDFWVDPSLAIFSFSKHSKSKCGVIFTMSTPTLCNIHDYDIGKIFVRNSHSPKYQIVLLRDYVSFNVEGYYDAFKSTEDSGEMLIITNPETKVTEIKKNATFVYQNGRIISVSYDDKCKRKDGDDCVCY